MEIERRWKINSLPENINLNSYTQSIIRQWYIGFDPIVRIRNINDNKFILCFKKQIIGKQLAVNEIEINLNKNEFYNLLQLTDKNPISKTRYDILLDDGLIAELDVFNGYYKSMYIIEVEFDSEEMANNFIPPKWFGDNEITGNGEYSNAKLYINAPAIYSNNEI